MSIATAGQFADLPRFGAGMLSALRGALAGAPRKAALEAIAEPRLAGERVRTAEEALDADEREALLLSLGQPAELPRAA